MLDCSYGSVINYSKKFFFNLPRKVRARCKEQREMSRFEPWFVKGLFSSLPMCRFVYKFSRGGRNAWRSTTALWVSRNDTFFDNIVMSLSTVSVPREFNSRTLGYSMTRSFEFVSVPQRFASLCPFIYSLVSLFDFHDLRLDTWIEYACWGFLIELLGIFERKKMIGW